MAMTTQPPSRPGGAPAAETSSASAGPSCACSPNQFSPDQAAHALRELASSWRQLFHAQPGAAAECRQRVTRRLSNQQWTVLEHAAHVRDMLHAKTVRLTRIRSYDEPVVDETLIDAPLAGDNEWDPAVIVLSLAANAERLVREIEATPPADWARTGIRNGVTVTARTLLQEAVHDASHHLHQAHALLAAMGAAPPG